MGFSVLKDNQGAFWGLAASFLEKEIEELHYKWQAFTKAFLDGAEITAYRKRQTWQLYLSEGKKAAFVVDDAPWKIIDN